MTFKGATGSRPLSWGGLQPGGILPCDNKFKVGNFSGQPGLYPEGIRGTLALSLFNPKPQLTRVDENIEVVRYSAPKSSPKGDNRNFLYPLRTLIELVAWTSINRS